jgi:hypothetical protein
VFQPEVVTRRAPREPLLRISRSSACVPVQLRLTKASPLRARRGAARSNLVHAGEGFFKICAMVRNHPGNAGVCSISAKPDSLSLMVAFPGLPARHSYSQRFKHFTLDTRGTSVVHVRTWVAGYMALLGRDCVCGSDAASQLEGFRTHPDLKSSPISPFPTQGRRAGNRWGPCGVRAERAIIRPRGRRRPECGKRSRKWSDVEPRLLGHQG